jgi:RNA polymerase sigma-70 factor (ECF subfamily)
MTGASSEQVTGLLRAWSNGQPAALEQLIPLVHQELQATARRYMKGERPDHTLQPTALVNEAFVRLTGVRRIQWQDRAHFLALAARLMRRILIEWARARRVQKRGGAPARLSLDDACLVTERPSYDVLALDEVLERLAALDPRRASVVELRFFGGLTLEETAAALQLSPDTVTRDWKLAKAWLAREMKSLP